MSQQQVCEVILRLTICNLQVAVDRLAGLPSGKNPARVTSAVKHMTSAIEDLRTWGDKNGIEIHAGMPT